MGWTAVVAVVSGALAAWQEFTSVAKKVERYSTVSHSLGDILMWWQALPEVDKSIMTNVEHLVEWTEDVVTSEHSAWLSSARQAVKSKQSDKDQDEPRRQDNQAKIGGHPARN